MMYDKFIDQARRTIADCYNDGYSDGIQYGKTETINRVLAIIATADESYELWALKFQKVREEVLALKGDKT